MFQCRHWIGCFSAQTWVLPGYSEEIEGSAAYPFITYKVYPWMDLGFVPPLSLIHYEEDMSRLPLLTSSLRIRWEGMEVLSNRIPRVSRATIGQPQNWEVYNDTGLVGVKPPNPLTGRPDTKESPRIPLLTLDTPLPAGFTIREGPVILCEMNIVLTMPLDIAPKLGIRKQLFSYIPTLQRELWKIPKDYGQVVRIRLGIEGIEKYLFLIFDRSDDYDLGDPLAWADGMAIVLKEAQLLDLGELVCIRPPAQPRMKNWKDACNTVAAMSPLLRPRIIFMIGQRKECKSL